MNQFAGYVSQREPYRGFLRDAALVCDLLRKHGFHLWGEDQPAPPPFISVGHVACFLHSQCVVNPLLRAGMGQAVYNLNESLLWDETEANSSVKPRSVKGVLAEYQAWFRWALQVMTLQRAGDNETANSMLTEVHRATFEAALS